VDRDEAVARIVELEAANAVLSARIIELEAFVVLLVDKITVLERLVKGDSSNSSRPPCSDGATAKNKLELPPISGVCVDSMMLA